MAAARLALTAGTLRREVLQSSKQPPATTSLRPSMGASRRVRYTANRLPRAAPFSSSTCPPNRARSFFKWPATLPTTTVTGGRVPRFPATGQPGCPDRSSLCLSRSGQSRTHADCEHGIARRDGEPHRDGASELWTVSHKVPKQLGVGTTGRRSCLRVTATQRLVL